MSAVWAVAKEKEKATVRSEKKNLTVFMVLDALYCRILCNRFCG